jgi:hypothetical protein
MEEMLTEVKAKVAMLNGKKSMAIVQMVKETVA